MTAFSAAGGGRGRDYILIAGYSGPSDGGYMATVPDDVRFRGKTGSDRPTAEDDAIDP